jgi:hypothetical protein
VQTNAGFEQRKTKTTSVTVAGISISSPASIGLPRWRVASRVVAIECGSTMLKGARSGTA